MPYTHFSDKEIAKMDSMLKSKTSPKQIWKQVQHDRERSGSSGPSLAAVYRFTCGRSYKRNAKEKRGSKSKVPKNMLRIANAEHIKLLKAATNETGSDTRYSAIQKNPRKIQMRLAPRVFGVG